MGRSFDTGFSTTAPSTQASKESMPASSSAMSSTGSVGAKFDSTEDAGPAAWGSMFHAGSQAHLHWSPVPRVDLPPVGEEQSSASAAAQAEPVEDEPLAFGMPQRQW